MFTYDFELVRVVDGDTVIVDIDVGFGIWLRNQKIRLAGYDSPESRTKDPVEKKYGYYAKEMLMEMLETWPLKIKTTKEGKGKFGRILADFVDEEGLSVVALLIEHGAGVAYHGQSKMEIQEAHLANRSKINLP